MVRIHKPRSGSLAYYPRKRAKQEKPRFKRFKVEESSTESVKPLFFLGYKVGMAHAMGINMHKGSPSYQQRVAVPVTIIETPPMKVFGLVALTETPKGEQTLMHVLVDKVDKHVARRLKGVDKRESKEEWKKKLEELKQMVDTIKEVRLLAHTQPALTTIGKKKPEIVEVPLSGSVEEQLKFCEERMGKEITISDVVEEKTYVDVKAVTKGKGFQGVIKRFGVKMHRPKAKTRRVVGSIGPWHPPTVMFTVARPGQMGYHTRTELNKKLIKIGKGEDINPAGGFKNYGIVKNEYVVLIGSIPGPAKRCIAIRAAVRPRTKEKIKIEEVEQIVTR
jgi:large subunit ribosomal protein L3